MNSTEFWLLYRAQGLRIGLWENWLVFTAGQLANLLPGQVGTLYRFRYLKVVHRFSYGRSGSRLRREPRADVRELRGRRDRWGWSGVVVDGGHRRPWIVAAVVGLAVVSIAVIAVPVPAVPVLTGGAVPGGVPLRLGRPPPPARGRRARPRTSSLEVPGWSLALPDLLRPSRG